MATSSPDCMRVIKLMSEGVAISQAVS